MNSSPAVSVLMPVYNGEAYLHEAVDSILNQTFRDFEFVIINDGSTDGTQAILADYERRDERIQVVLQQRQGLPTTLNRGLEMTRGEYVARMDADDVSHPERLATQVAYLKNHPEVGLAGTNCYLIGPTGAVTGGPIPGRPLYGPQVEWELYWGNPIVHPSVMYRAVDIIACGGYPTRYSHYAEDYALWFKVVDITEAAVLQRPLLLLRKHQHNVTADATEEHLAEVAEVAQSALAARLGYRAPLSSINLVRYAATAQPVAAAEVHHSVRLLQDTFESLVTRGGLVKEQIRPIETDLFRRMLRLAMLSLDRSYSLKVYSQVVCLSPKLALTRLGVRTLSGLLFSH